MRLRILVATVATVVTVATAVTVAIAATAASAGDDATHRYVVAITGSRDYGFHVTWSDGEERWTPTLSETLAECGEYHRAVRGTRCATRARTAYRWMGVVKRSLRHHHP